MTESYFMRPEMSASQFKAFRKCEAGALAEIEGRYTPEKTAALLVGSYVDAHFSGALDAFKSSNPEIFTKQGALRAEYRQADAIIERIERDKMFSRYMSGEPQVTMTGEIGGVPFRCKMDVYHVGRAIVDLKIMKDFERIWVDGEKLPFVEAWGYDIQGAIYQEIVYQNTGDRLPFFIAAATKEREPNIGLFGIPQDRLNYCLQIVKENAPRYHEIKIGAAVPQQCGKCDFCKHTKVLTEILDYREAV